jgi:hypothetical protein
MGEFGQVRADAAKAPADPGGGELGGWEWLFPGSAQVGGEGP